MLVIAAIDCLDWLWQKIIDRIYKLSYKFRYIEYDRLMWNITTGRWVVVSPGKQANATGASQIKVGLKSISGRLKLCGVEQGLSFLKRIHKGTRKWVG